MLKYKDDVLVDYLKRSCNVAQFVSYSPNKVQRHSAICGHDVDKLFDSIQEAVAILLSLSSVGSVNIRTFKPEQWDGNPFIRNLTDVESVLIYIEKLCVEGYHVIVHETIDVCDGGINCVLANGVVEFVPDDTPRFVEKVSELPIPSLKVDDFIEFLSSIYEGVKTFKQLCQWGDSICTENDTTTTAFRTRTSRVEFSFHPTACGYYNDNIIIWEVDRDAYKNYDNLTQHSVLSTQNSFYNWPNAFSKHIGDKAYGLLVANMFIKTVPKTTVYPRDRRIGAFTFGRHTGCVDIWTRTCPNVQVPGKYTTIKDAVNPYTLMEDDDPEGKILTSCLIQSGVNAKWSGAYIKDESGTTAIEGVQSYGDGYMQGAEKETIPDDVYWRVVGVANALELALKSYVRFEWVDDGTRTWVVQLHIGATQSDIKNKIIYKKDISRYISYNPADGLDKLRELVASIQETEHDNKFHANIGIRVVGNIGMSSHVADILRKAHIGSYIYVQENMNDSSSN